MIIKALLLSCLAVAGLLVFRGRVTAAHMVMRRLAAAAVLGLGVAAVAYPTAVTAVANYVGVGRGADLILYILVVTFMLSSIALYRRIHELENKYVDLARQLAISEAARRTDSGAGPRSAEPADFTKSS